MQLPESVLLLRSGMITSAMVCSAKLYSALLPVLALIDFPRRIWLVNSIFSARSILWRASEDIVELFMVRA
jgi:hypothetical protein